MSSTSSFVTQRKTVVCMEPLSRILTFVVPKLQRNLSESHIQKMVEDQKAEYDKYGCFSMLQSITVASLNTDIYVLDGQHRLQAFSDLAKMGYPIGDVVLPVIVYYVGNLDELAWYYNRINQHMPIHPLELTDTWDMYEKPLIKLITTHYEAYFKDVVGGTGCRCPHIAMADLKKAMQDREVGKRLNANGKSALQMWNDIEALNNYVKKQVGSALQLCPTMRKRIDDCEAKVAKGIALRVCYLGIWRHFEWLDIALTTLLNKVPLKNIDMSSFTAVRRKIPATVRQQVWAKCNAADHGRCYVCDNDLYYKDMECGHVLAHALGGQDTVENLMPVCKMCNRDMGIMNMMDYKALVDSMTASSSNMQM